jgi:hypothetical protein
VLTLRKAMPVDIDSDYERKPLCANEQGFSLHAAVRCHANSHSEALVLKNQSTTNGFSPNILAVKVAACNAN